MKENQELSINELLLYNIGQMSAVYHLTNELINVEDLEGYYNALITNIPQISGFKNIIIYKLNNYKNEVEIAVSTYETVPNEIKFIKINADVCDPFIAAVTGMSKIFKKDGKYKFDPELSKYYESKNFAVIPLKTKKDVKGLVVVSNENNEPIDTERFDMVKLISNMAAFIYENLLLKTELEVAQAYFYDYIDIISRQFRLISVLNSATSKTDILNVLTDNVKKSISIDYVIIFEYNNEANILQIVQASDNVPKKIIEKKYSDISLDDLIYKSYRKKEIFNIDVRVGDKFSFYGKNIRELLNELKINNFVIVPLLGKESLFSVVFFGTIDKKITTQDFDELRMFCNQVGTAYENELLTEKIKILNNQMEEDLNTASQIQQSLLPKDLSLFDDFDIVAENIQTSYIGGDFYLVNKNTNNEVFIAIGDVCGHGPSAALVMALIMQIYNDEIKESDDLSEILNNVNNRYCNSVETDIAGFVTSFAVQVNPKEKFFYFANAGHNYPYYYNSKLKTLTQIEQSTFFFGLDENTKYEKSKIEYNKNDILILYTDGIVEAVNEKNEQFGYVRFEKVLRDSIDLSIDIIKTNVITAVKNFVKTKEFNDDWTIVISKF